MYHGVAERTGSLPCWHVIDVQSFRQQMEYVRRHFTVLPLEEALERLEAGTLPDRAATLTFDDGTRNLAEVAGPVLDSLGLPAAVFLTTGSMDDGSILWPDRLWLAFERTAATELDLTAIGLPVQSMRSPADRGSAYARAVLRLKDLPDPDRIATVESIIATLGPVGGGAGPFQMLSWDEARAYAGRSDVSLYPHTVTHPILSRCSDEKVGYEVHESCAALEREIGNAPGVFAYPNGRAQDFDERARAALRARGIRWALAVIVGFADRHSDPLALPRIPIGSDMSFARFRLFVSGAFGKPWKTSLPTAKVS